MSSFAICCECDMVFDMEDDRRVAYQCHVEKGGRDSLGVPQEPDDERGEFQCPHCGEWQEGVEIGVEDLMDGYNDLMKMEKKLMEGKGE